MNFWNPFKRKSDEPSGTETKNLQNYTQGGCPISPYLLGLASGSNLLRNIQAWRYYEKISPVFDAVEKKQKAMKTILPAVYDTVDKVYYHEQTEGIEATQILPFLKKPNREKKWLEFVASTTASYEVTGDIFILVTSMSEGDRPLEFYFINPSDMSPIAGTDGTVETWRLNSNQFNESFNYVENAGKGVSSYFTADGTKEIWQIKTFNPRESQLDFFGLSPLNAIMAEIEQYEYSNIHNSALLQNGATPSGVLVVDKDFDLGPDQYERMRAQVNAKYGGPEAAGSILILEGGKEFKQLSLSPKDMDYINLLKFVREQIYITKGIPLPLVTAASMTMNNFEEAKYMLFDTDVLPYANTFYSEMDDLLMRRFDDSGRYVLSYDKAKISALEVKRNAATKTKIDTGLLTVNEGRVEIGAEERDEGNVLLINSSQIPLSMAGASLQTTEVAIKSYDYKSVMGRIRAQWEEKLNDEDERKFTDEDIDNKLIALYGRKE